MDSDQFQKIWQNNSQANHGDYEKALSDHTNSNDLIHYSETHSDHF
jgi:hypothetical protein